MGATSQSRLFKQTRAFKWAIVCWAMTVSVTLLGFFVDARWATDGELGNAVWWGVLALLLVNLGLAVFLERNRPIPHATELLFTAYSTFAALVFAWWVSSPGVRVGALMTVAIIAISTGTAALLLRLQAREHADEQGEQQRAELAAIRAELAALREILAEHHKLESASEPAEPPRDLGLGRAIAVLCGTGAGMIGKRGSKVTDRSGGTARDSSE